VKHRDDGRPQLGLRVVEGSLDHDHAGDRLPSRHAVGQGVDADVGDGGLQAIGQIRLHRPHLDVAKDRLDSRQHPVVPDLELDVNVDGPLGGLHARRHSQKLKQLGGEQPAQRRPPGGVHPVAQGIARGEARERARALHPGARREQDRKTSAELAPRGHVLQRQLDLMDP
jgi:hypothetical protein